MRTRLSAWLALAVLAVLVRPMYGEGRKPAQAVPTVIVRLKSLDGLIADARYLTEMAGKEEEAKQAEGFLKQLTGPKGLEGIDTTKPSGLYGKLGPNGVDSEVVVMLPIADEATALEFLKRFTKPEKGDDGVYTVNVERSPFPIFFRFVDGYAYVTLRDKEIIDKTRLLKPAEILAPNKIGTLSATINLDQIPKQMKQMAIGNVELRNAAAKEETKPGETEALRNFRAMGIDWTTSSFKQVLNEGGPIDLRLDIDRQAGQLALSVSLAALQGTRLADEISSLGVAKSTVSGLVGANSAISIQAKFKVLSPIQKALEAALEEAAAKLPQEKDETQRKLGKLFLTAIRPTIKAGDLDAALSVSGPGPAGKFAMVLGAKVQDGPAIEKALRAAFEELPAKEKEKAKLDFARVGNVNVHQLKPDNTDEKTREMLGDGPMYLAARDDALLVGGGEKGLEALKDALSAPGKAGVIAQFEMSVRRFARILERENPGATEAAKKVFAKDPDADKMRFTLTGGKALTGRFAMSTPLIRFFLLIGEAKKKAADN